ncbi:hypothetical protein FGO68_gene8323 [Halteria grandinella]|uniref:Uncharacterized protein n=1 Tax=Halteria grandinella TaxID=5974 RepID=A0A8J8NYH3_HALGN|nr:hypothetical protein FGO68_gene8323 [Halteria grandinella]
MLAVDYERFFEVLHKQLNSLKLLRAYSTLYKLQLNPLYFYREYPHQHLRKFPSITDYQFKYLCRPEQTLQGIVQILVYRQSKILERVWLRRHVLPVVVVLWGCHGLRGWGAGVKGELEWLLWKKGYNIGDARDIKDLQLSHTNQLNSPLQHPTLLQLMLFYDQLVYLEPPQSTVLHFL